MTVYIVDFFKRMFNKTNIPSMLYILLNVAIITIAVFYFVNSSVSGSMKLWQAALIALGGYIACILVALSPFGEWLLRKINKCHRVTKDRDPRNLEAIFVEVYRNARELNSSIPNDVGLYVKEDIEPNAFALGRKTVCVTTALMDHSDEEIKAAMSHEFGHLAHKDTDLILVISVGNLIIMGIALVIRLLILFIQLLFLIAVFLIGLVIGDRGALTTLVAVASSFLVNVFVNGLIWLWTKVGVLLVMKSHRENEYLADEFAFNLGYGEALCRLLDMISIPGKKSFFSCLKSAHPKTEKRIARLRELGVKY